MKISWVALGLVLGTLCLAKVKTQVGTAPRFSEYKTYQWLPPRVLTRTGLLENDDTVAPLIKRAVNRELASYGFTEVSDGADIQVSTLALKESIPQLEALIYPGGLDWGVGMPIATIGRYNHQGTLVVNLIDTATKKSAWAALATEKFDKPEQLESTINKAASNIFKRYPAKKTAS